MDVDILCLLKIVCTWILCELFVLKALKNYNETTEERKLAFENLKAKDEKSSYEIETQMRKLQRIQVINNILSCHKNLMASCLNICTFPQTIHFKTDICLSGQHFSA